MALLRSRRLEQVLGAPLSELKFAHVASLADGRVPEQHDVEFKSQLYGQSERARRDLASDVAAMANTTGGIIFLGVQEDAHACASAVSAVDLKDEHVTRMYQIIASNVFPTPLVAIESYPNPDNEEVGVVAIFVPRSPMSPHAVFVNESSLRYPRRHGTTTVHLREAEVAESYRRRFNGIMDRYMETQRVEADLVARLNLDQVFVVVTLVPDLEAEFALDQLAFQRFQQELQHPSASEILDGRSWLHFSLRRGRLTASNRIQDGRASFRACELHTKGVGTCATAIASCGSDIPPAPESRIPDEETVLAIVEGLRFVGRHARDRAGTGGFATVRGSIVNISKEHPAHLINRRGFHDPLGRQPIDAPPIAECSFDIDDLATDGAPLIVAAHRLASELFQEFGVPESLQLTAEGAIRLPYWDQSRRPQLEKWAKHAVFLRSMKSDTTPKQYSANNSRGRVGSNLLCFALAAKSLPGVVLVVVNRWELLLQVGGR